MNLVKKSLLSAVTVVALSSSVFGAMMDNGMMMGHNTIKTSGNIDLDYAMPSTSEANVVFTSTSADKKVTGVLKIETKVDSVKLDKLYATYKDGAITYGVGAKIALKGNFTDDSGQGVTVSTKIGDVSVMAGALQSDGDDLFSGEQILAVKGMSGMFGYKADLQVNNKNIAYGATVALKTSGVTLNAGYAGTTTDATKMIMGANAGYKMDMLSAEAGLTIAGAGNTKDGFLFDNAGDLPASLGSNGFMGTVMYAKVGAKVLDIALSATGVSTGDDLSWSADATKKIAGAKIVASYNSSLVFNLELSSKF